VIATQSTDNFLPMLVCYAIRAVKFNLRLAEAVKKTARHINILFKLPGGWNLIASRYILCLLL